MTQILCLDTHHDGVPGAIAVYVVLGPEPTLVDPGPATVRPRVLESLRAQGIPPGDIRHICVTHVHLDHAGSAGAWVAEYPDIAVHVHEEAALHLVDPRRLVVSTRRTFGDAHDRLWGRVVPVPAHAIRAVRPGEVGPFRWLRALHTPGHIEQHLAYLHEVSGTLFSGDSMGILLGREAPVHPPTPPPTLDLAAWLGTLREIEAVAPEQVGATHFGLHREVKARAAELRTALLDLASRAEGAMERGREEEDAEAFQEETIERLRRHRPNDEVERYFTAFSAANDYRGMVRYLRRNPDWSGA
ncbi:MAG: MBL fold metallo-hydrolase [Gemmatimonadales bacterium]|nr:MAG: MBL fold metallo-hydrolase [Gemmatimonadales bacterium]